jgi:chorismate--pyruvate lyase
LPYQQRHRRIAAEPEWRPQNRYASADLPPGCRAWLLDDGSLTGRLIDLGRGPLRVERLYQGWQVPLASERRLLSLPPRHIALVREVALRLGGDPVVFARSVFPIASLTGSLAHLRRLQNRSLGAILFQHPGMRRSPFELAKMAGDCDYLPPALRQEQAAWGRRSRFEIAGKGLLVSEVFLHAFTPWPAVLPLHRSQRGKVNAAILRSTQ